MQPLKGNPVIIREYLRCPQALLEELIQYDLSGPGVLQIAASKDSPTYPPAKPTWNLQRNHPFLSTLLCLFHGCLDMGVCFLVEVLKGEGTKP